MSHILMQENVNISGNLARRSWTARQIDAQRADRDAAVVTENGGAWAVTPILQGLKLDIAKKRRFSNKVDAMKYLHTV